MERIHSSSQWQKLEFWLVGGLAGVSIISAKALPWAVGTAALFGGVRWLTTGRPVDRRPVNGPVLGLMGMLAVSVWVTPDLQTTWTQVLRTLAGIGLFYAILHWAKSRMQFRLLAAGIAASGLILAMGGLFGIEWASEKLNLIPASFYERFPAVITDTANPNVMAGSLVLFLPVVLAGLAFGGQGLHWLERLLAVISGLAMAGIVVLTQSRGAWLALGIGLIVLLVLRWRWGWIVLLAGAIACGASLVWFGAGSILESVAANASLGGLAGRWEVWSRAGAMIRDFPFTGIGIGTFTSTVDRFYPFFYHPPGSVEHAHNLFLQIAVDIGLPGLIVWLTILGSVVVASWQVYKLGKATEAQWLAGLGAGLLASQLALLTHGLLDAVTWGMVRPAPLVWVLWGLALAAREVGVEGRRTS